MCRVSMLCNFPLESEEDKNKDGTNLVRVSRIFRAGNFRSEQTKVSVDVWVKSEGKE